jgi:hypothetical protein
LALETKCLTPGCKFHTHIKEDSWHLDIEFPSGLSLSETEAELVTALLHNQVELVLAYFQTDVSAEKLLASLLDES